MKAAIIYHSVTGNTQRMGEVIAQGMASVDGTEVRTFPINAVDFDYVKDCQCVIFGSPIYAAHITGDMTVFLQQSGKKLSLAGKLCGAYTTAQYIHGGDTQGIQDMLTHCLVYGAMVYSGGSADGTPVIHLGPVGIDRSMDISTFDETFRIYGQRMANQARLLFH